MRGREIYGLLSIARGPVRQERSEGEGRAVISVKWDEERLTEASTGASTRNW